MFSDDGSFYVEMINLGGWAGNIQVVIFPLPKLMAKWLFEESGLVLQNA